MSSVIVVFLFTIFAQDTIYYVSSNGRDVSNCGSQTVPCASINQVMHNHPYDSYTISIAVGLYKTDYLYFDASAYIVFQGDGNPTIVASWNGTHYFISTTDTSGYEFRDLTLSLFGDGDYAFSALWSEENSIGFYNVILTYASNQYQYVYSEFINVVGGGTLVLSNVTFSQAIMGANFIGENGNGYCNITITGSSFFNNSFLQDSSLVKYHGTSIVNISIDSTTFDGISAQYPFILFIAEDTEQMCVISNSIFSNSNTSQPSVSIQNAYYIQHRQELAIIQNTTWINSTADIRTGAIEIMGSDSDDKYDCKLILNNLTFANCVGQFAGGLVVYCNSFNLSNSTFKNNSAKGGYGNDLVQVLNANTADFKYNITDSYSTSALPKAAIWDDDSDFVTDISDQLPNPSQYVVVRRFSWKGVSASPKFGRKEKKYYNK